MTKNIHNTISCLRTVYRGIETVKYVAGAMGRPRSHLQRTVMQIFTHDNLLKTSIYHLSRYFYIVKKNNKYGLVTEKGLKSEYTGFTWYHILIVYIDNSATSLNSPEAAVEFLRWKPRRIYRYPRGCGREALPKRISRHSSINLCNVSRNRYGSTQKYWNYSTFCYAWYAATGHITGQGSILGPLFSSPEPKARVSYCHSAPSVVRPSVRPSVVVVVVVVRKLSHFRLLLQIRLMDFWWNLVCMKYSWSLTSVVVFRPDPPRGGSRAGQK